MDPEISVKDPKAVVDALQQLIKDNADFRKDYDAGKRTYSEFVERVEKTVAEFATLSEAVRELQQKAASFPLPGNDSVMEMPKSFRVIVDAVDRNYAPRQLADAYLKSMSAPKGSDLERYQIISDAVTMFPTRWAQRKRGAWWREEMESLQRKLLGKAMDTATANEGTEWVPAEVMSSTLIDLVREGTPVANCFTRVPLSSKVNKIPVLDADSVVYVLGESTVHNQTVFTESTPNSGNVNLTPIKMCVRVLTATEMIEDATFDQMQFIRGNVRVAIEESVDNCILNGDVTSASATHFDTGRTITGATDPLVASWDGLRRIGHSTTGLTHDIGGTGVIALADLAAALSKMGKWGSSTTRGGGAVLICSWGLNAYIAALGAAYTSYTGMLGNAPVVSGAVGNILGVEVVPTGFYPTTENASGIITATTTSTFTGGVLAARNRWLIGDRRQITVRASDDLYMETDQSVAVATARIKFAPTQTPAASTYPFVIKLYNG